MGSPSARSPAAGEQTRRGWKRDTIVYAVLAQAGILVVTVFVAVAIPRIRDEPKFTAKPTIYLPQRELEHRVAVAEFQQAAATPLQLEKLVTSALLPPDLPVLPTVPKTDFNPLDSTAFLSQDAQALLAQSGLMGAVTGLKNAASTAAFFGIEDSGERIVIVVNTSVSVRNKAQRRGVAWDHIQSEVSALVGRLDAATQFGIVQFSQGVRQFTEFLAPATAGNRAAASEWVRGNLAGNPRIAADQLWFGHEAALEAAFRFEPDIIFLVTDGVLDRRENRGGRASYPKMPYGEFSASIRSFQRKSSRTARIHVVGFELEGEDAQNMRAFVREFRGQLREF